MTNSNFEIPIEKKRPWWLRCITSKELLGIMILLCLLSIPKMYFILQSSKLPDIDHPFDVEAFGTVEIKTEDNAFLDYQQAAKKYVKQKSSVDYDDIQNAIEGDWSVATEPVEKWLDDNQEALSIWKKGTEKSDYLSHQPKDWVLNGSFSPYEYLYLAKLASLQANRLLSKGNINEAWQWHLAAFRFSRHVGKHGTIMERLRGGAFHANATIAILHWANDPHVTAKQLSLAMDDLTREYEKTELFATNLKCNYLNHQEAISKYYDVFDSKFLSEKNRRPWFLFSAEPDISHKVAKHFFKNWLSHVDKPRYLRPFQSTKYFLYDSIPGTVASSNCLKPDEIAGVADYAVWFWISWTTYMDIRLVLETTDREKTRQGILIVVLATQQYKRDHGDFPPDSATLIKEGYLKEMPLDALQYTKLNIKYKKTKTCTTVYSLGRDEIDNGGEDAELRYHHDQGDFGYVLESRK